MSTKHLPKTMTDESKRPHKVYEAVATTAPCQGCDRHNPAWCDVPEFCELKETKKVWKRKS